MAMTLWYLLEDVKTLCHVGCHVLRRDTEKYTNGMLFVG